MKKKILIFAIDYYPYVGGAEVAVREVCKRLSDFEFIMIAAWNDRKIPKEEFIDNVRVFRVGLGLRGLDKYILTIPAFLTAVKLHKKYNFQIVWGLMANTASLAALFFKIVHPSVNYILTLQEGESWSYYLIRTWFWRPLYKAIYRQADAIQVISNYLAGWAHTFDYGGTVYLIPNGVDINIFESPIMAEETNFLKNELGIRDGERVVITTSRLARKNGLEYLIKGFNIFKNKNDFPVKLLMVGEGELKKKLMDMTQRLGIAKEVLFLGFIEYNRLPLYLNIADVFVRPSLTEGLGNSFLEAMAVGLPIIGTPVGGIVDFLKDEQTGIFCKPADSDSVAVALERVFSNDGLRSNLIRNGKTLVRERYSWNRVAYQMSDLFSKF